jgi:hypothetical protein
VDSAVDIIYNMLIKGVSMRKIVASMLIFATAAMCGEWSVGISINPYPSPYISDWEDTPGILNASVTHLDSVEERVIIAVRVTGEKAGDIIRAETEMNFAPQETKTLSNVDIADFSGWYDYSEDFKRKVEQSGRIPEGTYTLRMEVRSLTNDVYAYDEANFFIESPSPPFLISPPDCDTLSTLNPVFQWSPVVSPRPFVYRLRLCEVIKGQTRFQAIRNPPLLEEDLENRTSFFYSPSEYPLEDGKMYVWRVRAFDESGTQIGENEGKGDIRTFFVSLRQPSEIKEITIIVRDTINVGDVERPVLQIKGNGYMLGIVYIDGSHFQDIESFISDIDTLQLLPLPSTEADTGRHTIKTTISSPNSIETEEDYIIR